RSGQGGARRLRAGDARFRLRRGQGLRARGSLRRLQLRTCSGDCRQASALRGGRGDLDDNWLFPGPAAGDPDDTGRGNHLDRPGARGSRGKPRQAGRKFHRDRRGDWGLVRQAGGAAESRRPGPFASGRTRESRQFGSSDDDRWRRRSGKEARDPRAARHGRRAGGNRPRVRGHREGARQGRGRSRRFHVRGGVPADRAARHPLSPALVLHGHGVRRVRRLHVLWAPLHRQLPEGREVRRQDTQGSQAGRHTVRAADKARARHQHEDRESDGHEGSAVDPASRRQGDRVTARGSLFRKYVFYFVVVVSAALVASGAVGLYFAYQENKSDLLALQREKAAGAASRIEAYVQEIEHQLGWMRLPQLGGASLEQRRIDFLKLLRQVPAITDLSHLDKAGVEQLRVSRLGMDVAGSREDFSRDPKFTEARASKTWFSPVYFRKETEPYMTIAVAGTSDEAGVTVAEVNLKFIWDVISRIKIGEKGLAYAVDSRGRLIAHPDISLVLQKLDLSALPQVKAASEGKSGED